MFQEARPLPIRPESPAMHNCPFSRITPTILRSRQLGTKAGRLPLPKPVYEKFPSQIKSQRPQLQSGQTSRQCTHNRWRHSDLVHLIASSDRFKYRRTAEQPLSDWACPIISFSEKEKNKAKSRRHTRNRGALTCDEVEVVGNVRVAVAALLLEHGLQSGEGQRGNEPSDAAPVCK
jgi:hypothetical protein